MRYSPMRRVGKRTVAGRIAHLRDWQSILARQGYRCAGCGARDVALQDAHLAGRPGSGACLGPWADAPELRAGLCCADPRAGTLGCHERADRSLDPSLRDRLRWEAAARLADRLGTARPTLPLLLDPAADALGTIRELVRQLEAAGIAA